MSIVVEVVVALGAVLFGLIHFLHVLVLKPKSLRSKLQKQGIHGPSPHFYFGNIKEIKTLLLQQQELQAKQKEEEEDEDVTSTLFPHIHKWRNQYGPIYLFSSGSIQWLMVADMEMVKEILLNTSLDLGKPSYLSKDMGPLLGQGILSSSGPIWAHQRKIIAPELYLDKVKAMVDQIVDSTNIMLRSWESIIERDGIVSEIKIDEDLRSLSADIISRACFGSNYVQGKEIFTKLRDLQKVLSKIYAGIPGFRYASSSKDFRTYS
ncbi:cytochrome p450 734a1-like protein [Trifolium pratense]|uniref:Cytochrome p450 734a1-like protein n=1 Tax=Trifolium pratense TaxID=57577 RepID=A0A2K3LVP8_TRIPR|nr:cytochrome p450 734a1-like protein [Trifolium pratense]